MIETNRIQNAQQRDSSLIPQQTRNTYIFKAAVLIVLAAGFFIYKFTFNMDLTSPCIYDYLQEALLPVNRFIKSDPWKVIVVIGQLFIDGFILSLIIFWFFYMKNMSLINFALIVYLYRGILIQITYFPYPDHMIWQGPPVPSLFIPYNKTRDFFFSGHTSLAIVLCIEMKRFKAHWFIQYLTYVMIAWMPLMLISTRVHYTIDVLASPFYVQLGWDLHEKYKIYFEYIWSLPYIIYLWINRRFCQNQPQDKDNKLFDDHLNQ